MVNEVTLAKIGLLFTPCLGYLCHDFKFSALSRGRYSKASLSILLDQLNVTDSRQCGIVYSAKLYIQAFCRQFYWLMVSNRPNIQTVMMSLIPPHRSYHIDTRSKQDKSCQKTGLVFTPCVGSLYHGLKFSAVSRGRYGAASLRLGFDLLNVTTSLQCGIVHSAKSYIQAFYGWCYLLMVSHIMY